MMCNIALLHAGPVPSVMLLSLESEVCEIVESYCPDDLLEPFAYERADPMNGPEQSRDSKPNDGSPHKDADRTVSRQTDP